MSACFLQELHGDSSFLQVFDDNVQLVFWSLYVQIRQQGDVQTLVFLPPKKQIKSVKRLNGIKKKQINRKWATNDLTWFHSAEGPCKPQEHQALMNKSRTSHNNM